MYNPTSLVTNCGNRVHWTAAAPVHLHYHIMSQFSLSAVQQNRSCSKTVEREAQCSWIFCSTWTIRDGPSLLTAQHLPGTAEHEFSKQASQSSRLTQQLNRIIRECLVGWKTLNGHRQVEVSHPYSRRPWSTKEEMTKGNSNLIAREKITMFWGTVAQVVGPLLYTVQEKSLQQQAGVTYLTMPMTGSLSREDAETLTRYKKPYIMHCSYKLHVSSQKSVGNGLRPIKTWQTFLLGLEIPKSALPAPFPPSQPSPRGGVLMLSPLWKKLFDFSQC